MTQMNTPGAIVCGEATSDRELIGRFVASRDETAFAEIVSRHGACVLGVCRRLLYDEHEAEDVFQATFLVLARNASRIRHRTALGAWLYGVAYRLSRKANRRRLRRREQPLAETSEAMADLRHDPIAAMSRKQEQSALDEALHELPDFHRIPLVLRYLFQQSNQEIADQLGSTVSAIEGRIKRGKQQLRVRLARRGVGLAAAFITAQVSQSTTTAAECNGLLSTTVERALHESVHGKPNRGCGENANPLTTSEATRMTLWHSSTSAAIVLCALVAGISSFLSLPGRKPSGSEPIHLPGRGPQSTHVAAFQIGPGSDGTHADGSPSGQERNDPFSVDQAPAQPSDVEEDVSNPFRAVPAARPAPAADRAPSGEGASSKTEAPQRPQASQTSPSREDVDYKQWLPAERNILDRLSQNTRVQFLNTPLSDVLVFLKELHDIPIMVDVMAFEEAGKTTDIPVNADLDNVRLRSALRLILDPHGLDFAIGG